MMWKCCTKTNSDYYQPFLMAKKAVQEENSKELVALSRKSQAFSEASRGVIEVSFYNVKEDYKCKSVYARGSSVRNLRRFSWIFGRSVSRYQVRSANIFLLVPRLLFAYLPSSVAQVLYLVGLVGLVGWPGIFAGGFLEGNPAPTDVIIALSRPQLCAEMAETTRLTTLNK
ncbi:unnamed protein product [Arabidopsis thaliana]|uniref:Uncharacterized protein n=1 Tax=Arabidopsis thaliana TaxID=3702 RepID=A0A654ERC2_ARATH|nr:unnamed protein product [Arabidopsis thaliana]